MAFPLPESAAGPFCASYPSGSLSPLWATPGGEGVTPSQCFLFLWGSPQSIKSSFVIQKKKKKKEKVIVMRIHSHNFTNFFLFYFCDEYIKDATPSPKKCKIQAFS